MDRAELEGLAEGAYREAGEDPARPNVTRVARALLGAGSIVRGPRPICGPAALIRVGTEWRIYLAHSVPPTYAAFAVGHELGHWLLARAGVRDNDEQPSADYLGGALIAPRPAFLAAYRAVGRDFRQLAAAFSTTETGAALRLGEVLHLPLAVISPALVRVRGPEEWAWPDESVLRRWARRPAPGIRKVRLSDDPRRVVLDAEAIGFE